METQTQPPIKVFEEVSTGRRFLGASLTGIMFVVLFVGILLALGPNPDVTWRGD